MVLSQQPFGTQFRNVTVLDPKRDCKADIGRSSWYPFYAGFSWQFAHSLIASLKLSPESRIMDPWNGSGTTTNTALLLGHSAHGFDLNPVMVVAAKARLLSAHSSESLQPLLRDILQKAADGRSSDESGDPLCAWLNPKSAGLLRRIEGAILQLLVDTDPAAAIQVRNQVVKLSDLASFFYVGLFRTARRLLSHFIASNPTWVKRPRLLPQRLRPSTSRVTTVFSEEMREMIESVASDHTFPTNGDIELRVASSDHLPVDDGVVDLVFTSPPYCTRIDYAVATSFELAILGYKVGDRLDVLRSNLIGTSAVPAIPPPLLPAWGPTCTRFLDRIAAHPSKASRSYYLKSHLNYFDAIYRSLIQIARTLKPRGSCVIVVQDSYYKEVHNDLPQVFTEMADSQALRLAHRVDFHHARTMAGLNPAARCYRPMSTATESVLCFVKE